MKKLARLIGIRYTYDETDSNLARLTRKLNELRRGKGEPVQTTLNESELQRYNMPTPYWTDPPPAGRGLTQEMVDLFDLGYDPIRDCVTIPARDLHGRLLGFTRRFLDPDAPVRYKDPKGFQKGHNLFGAHLASEHESGMVVLVEGPLDAIKVWQAGFVAVAQYGSYLTVEQIRILRRMGTVVVVTFYDNDKGGRTSTSHALGYGTKTVLGKEVCTYTPEHDLRRHFIVKQVRYSRSASRDLDPGKMPDVQIKRSICAARTL